MQDSPALALSSSLKGAKVCLLTSAHPPDDDRVYFKEARSLCRMGAEVTLVCPAGKLPPEPPPNLRFVTFSGPKPLAQRFVQVGTLAALAGAHQPQIVHCHEPEALLAGLRVKNATGAKVIFDSHESWPATAAQKFPSFLWSAVEQAFSCQERRWLRGCDGAIGASWAISDYLKNAVPAERVETILNVPVPEVFGVAPEREWDGTTIVCHDGTLGFDRGLKTMVQAVHLVAARHSVVLKVVGDVFGREREWLVGYLQRHRIERLVARTGWLPYHQVGREIAACHIGLIALQRRPNNVVTSSNKVFNYMLYGLPFIGPDFRLAKAHLVKEHACGLLADSSSPSSYAAAIEYMIEHREETREMGRRALEASRAQYQWQHMEPRLLRLYQKVTALKAL